MIKNIGAMSHVNIWIAMEKYLKGQNTPHHDKKL